MGLIACPECKKKVSDKADSCPNCGYPIIKYYQNNKFEEKRNNVVTFGKVTVDLDVLWEQTHDAQKMITEIKNNTDGIEKDIIYVVNRYMNTNNLGRTSVLKEDTIYKCPNCYYILPSFVEKCPACGCEIRSNKVSKSVEDFSLKLAEIEKSNKAKKNKIMSNFNENIDDERISFIKNYPIPNTKEDIIEFLLLASSNINLSDFDNGYKVQEVEAWKSMYDHAYEKAKIILAGTSEFTDIKKAHDELEKSISSHKKKSNMLTAILVIGSIIFYIILMYWLR